jgi:glycosyltransferase involved in cell wall biosynthesis
MTRAIIVPFHPYQANKVTQLYWKWWQAWEYCFNQWEYLFDRVYLIDQGWGFDPSLFPDKFIICRTEDMQEPVVHHWDSFRQVIPHIEEDLILMMDNDMLIHDGEWMEHHLEVIEDEGYDVSAIWDGSGSIPLEEQFSFLRENSRRAYRRRVAPYMCFIKRKFLNKTNLEFAPKYLRGKGNRFYDSFGKWTEEVLSLNPKLHEIPDVRKFWFWEAPDKRWVKSMWLDGPEFQWSSPDMFDLPSPYYHVRNWSLGLYLINTFNHDKTAYKLAKKITPFVEAIRQLAWQELVGIDPNGVVQDLGVSFDSWVGYVEDMRNIHAWTGEL